MLHVDRIDFPRFRETTDRCPIRRAEIRDGNRRHTRERNLVKKFAEIAELMAQRGATAAGRGFRGPEGAVFMPDDERVIEIVIERSAGHQEIPSLDTSSGRAGVDAQGRYIISAFLGETKFNNDNFINVSGSVWRIKVGVSYDF